MREYERRKSVEGRDNYGYVRVSVVMERRARYGYFGCDITISMTGDVLCVVNKGLEGVR